MLARVKKGCRYYSVCFCGFCGDRSALLYFKSNWSSNRFQLKSIKDNKQDEDVQEGPELTTVGPEGEITTGCKYKEICLHESGYLLKKSAKSNGWSRKWFVLKMKKLGRFRSMAYL